MPFFTEGDSESRQSGSITGSRRTNEMWLQASNLNEGGSMTQFPQAQYHAALADYATSANGYGRLLTEADTPNDCPISIADALQGLSLSLPVLDRAGQFSSLAVTPEVHARRLATFEEWCQWSNKFPLGLRPSLSSCSPQEVVCFLEQWRVTRKGRARPGAAPGSTPEIAPGTLRNSSSNLSQLCVAAGRTDETWSPSNPRGNPVAHPTVTTYLSGYEQHCFQNTSYVSSGAVPMTLEVYLSLQDYLVGKADRETDLYQAALLWRDACLSAYLWETGQRGKEGCQLLVTDFNYDDTRCTPAWLDIIDGRINPEFTIVVESSNGTKSRKTKHPGTIDLSTAYDAMQGTGVLVQLLIPYSNAMRACGSPLLWHLFKPSNQTQDGFREGEYSSDAFNKRLQKHLTTMKAWNGETTHSLRRGSTQLLWKNGATVSEIGEKRLWKRDTTIDLYLHKARHKSRLVSLPLHQGPDAPI